MTSETAYLASYLDKGGTGKSTSIAHFAAALADEGYDVLAVDLAAKQSDLAKIFGVYEDLGDPEERWPNIATTLQPEWDTVAQKLSTTGESPVAELTIETDEDVDLIPAHPGLDSLDVELESKYDGIQKYQPLREFFDEYVNGYDAVLLDLPGAPNNVTYNGLWAAKHVVAPVRAGLLEAEQADVLREDLQSIEKELDQHIELTMVLPTMIDARTNLADEFLKHYDEMFPESVASRPIPDSQGIPNATANGRTLFSRDIKDEQMLATSQRARDAYRTNALEVYERINE